MGEFDLEAILKVAADEKVGANAQSFTGFFKEADNSLQSLDKIIDHLDKVYGFIHKLEKSPLIGTLFRQTYGSDKIGPLIKDDGGIIPKTNAHAQVIQNINNLDEQQLNVLLQRLLELDKKKKLEDEKKLEEEKKDEKEK
jgi:hypothetical protein